MPKALANGVCLDYEVIGPRHAPALLAISGHAAQLTAVPVSFVGGKRFMQRAQGCAATICAGEVVFEEEEPTGAMPERLLRGPHAVARST